MKNEAQKAFYRGFTGMHEEAQNAFYREVSLEQ